MLKRDVETKGPHMRTEKKVAVKLKEKKKLD